ncbi:PAS domain-containing protein, partial [Rhizobium ruizarguesonis]
VSIRMIRSCGIAPSAAVLFGRGGSIWNERMHELYGLAPSNGFMNEETWLSRIHPEDRKLALESASHFKKNGDKHTLVCRVLVDDGSVRYVRSV